MRDKRSAVKSLSRTTILDLCVFLLPGMALFLVFVIYPLIPEIIISLQKHNGIISKGFVGLNNYVKTLSSASFWKAEKNTLLITGMSVFIAIPITLLLALTMNVLSNRERGFYKWASVFPAVLSVTVVGKMWTAIYDYDWGIVNSILRGLGLERWIHVWLGEASTVVVCIGIAYLWQYIGLNGLLLYAGIKAIPVTYYEAAKIDGAGFFKANWYITIPLLQDVIKYVLLTSTLGSLGMFSYVEVMTGGGPGEASRSISYQMYYSAFSLSKFGEGCAIAMLHLIQCVIVALIINKTIAREKITY